MTSLLNSRVQVSVFADRGHAAAADAGDPRGGAKGGAEQRLQYGQVGTEQRFQYGRNWETS